MKTIQNAYLSHKKMHNLLFLMFAYCTILLLFRAKITQSIFYFFLVWNLFLAALPYLLLLLIQQKPIALKNNKTRFAIGSSWLLLLPNSFYILTDFVHLNKGNSDLLWFDILLLFSFSGLGFLLGLLSMQLFQKSARTFYSTKTVSLIMFLVSLLSGFGIYLGRFLRFNSWNIITNPFELLLSSFQTLFTMEAFLFSVLYGSFIYLLFMVLNHFNEVQFFSTPLEVTKR